MANWQPTANHSADTCWRHVTLLCDTRSSAELRLLTLAPPGECKRNANDDYDKICIDSYAVSEQLMPPCCLKELFLHSQESVSFLACRVYLTMARFQSVHTVRPNRDLHKCRGPAFWTAIFMVALCNRADHYIFILFLSFFLLFFLA